MVAGSARSGRAIHMSAAFRGESEALLDNRLLQYHAELLKVKVRHIELVLVLPARGRHPTNYSFVLLNPDVSIVPGRVLHPLCCSIRTRRIPYSPCSSQNHVAGGPCLQSVSAILLLPAVVLLCWRHLEACSNDWGVLQIFPMTGGMPYHISRFVIYSMAAGAQLCVFQDARCPACRPGQSNEAAHCFYLGGWKYIKSQATFGNISKCNWVVSCPSMAFFP